MFVTDLGEEITHTIKLAAKGNLSSKKRPFAKKLAALDSPKKMKSSSKISDIEDACTIHTNSSIHDCGCVSSRYWPSQESRDLDSNYGCGDAASVSEANDSLHDLESQFPRQAVINNMERCMSCISKLGAMSRSSTITVGTPAGNGMMPPIWTTLSEHYSSNTMPKQMPTVMDRMSMCSGSSGGNNSDYSRPAQMSTTNDSWYEPAPIVAQICNRVMSPPPDRPPKPNAKSPQPSQIGPYENYDVPRVTTAVVTHHATENYDTPKRIQEYLSKDANSNQIDKYGNYDMPVSIGKSVCGCEDAPRVDCTCTRLMSWTDSWICKRGNGIENTGIPVNKVRLTGEGKMPVVDASGGGGGGAIYATVDMAKKIKKRLECKCDKEPEPPGNYANLEFERSLENYENAKEVLQRAGLALEKVDVCQKCGHAPSGKTPDTPVNEPKSAENYLMMEPGRKESCPGYVPMNPVEKTTDDAIEPPPLPNKSDLLKQRMSKIIVEKSASNPSLVGPAVDRSQKRSNADTRVPGSAMMVMAQSGCSPYARKQLLDNSDLLPIDKRLTARKRSSSADSSRFLEEELTSPLLSGSPSTETLRNRRASSPCVHQETEVCQETECCATPTTVPLPTELPDEISHTSTNTATSTSQSTSTSQNSQSVYIRRSESVPCKAQNRDSSSSNDSGVSTGSLRQNEFELPLTTAMSSRRHQKNVTTCVHASLPRRSKSFDPLRDLSFQFQRVKLPEKSTSAEAEVPVCPQQKEVPSTNTTGPPYVDSRSTSSGTSDMSDYIETLSLSSHSSSDAPELR